MWPDAARRYCTSDHKRAQVYKVLTKLTAETRSASAGRRVRILNCLGIRADESPARSKKSPFSFDKMASNGRRHVDTWLPIFDWTVETVWERIRMSGVRYHKAYDLGMPRLSCCFCVLGNRDALLLAGHHNKALLAEYVRVEEKIGHTFRKSLPIVQIQRAVEAGEQPKGKISTWCM